MTTTKRATTLNADRRLNTYDASRVRYLVLFERAMAIADRAESVAETIVRAVRDRSPHLRYSSGKAGRQIAFARRFLPRSLFDKTVRKQIGLA